MTTVSTSETLNGADAWAVGPVSAGVRTEEVRGAEVRGAEVRGAEVRGAEVRGAEVRGAEVRGAEVRGAEVRGAEVRGAEVRGAEVRGAEVRGAEVRGAEVRGAEVRGAEVRGAEVRGAEVRGAEVRGAEVRGAEVRGAEVRGAEVRGAEVRGAEVRGAEVRGAEVRGAEVRGAEVRGAEVRGAEVRGAEVRGAEVRGAEVRGAEVRGAEVRGAEVRGAEVRGAEVRGAEVRGAEVRGAEVRGAEVRGAEVRGAEVRGAEVRGAEVRGAEVRGAEVRGAEVRGAEVRGAEVRGAEVRGAEVRGAEVRGAEVRGAEEAAGALRRAADVLGELQHDEGWWKGELETNVTMDAEDLLLREFLGVRTHEQTAASARWIRSQQRDDGTWSTFFGGPGDLSTTVEAYVALRLAGDPTDAEHMRQAAGFVRDSGGIERTRVFTRFWLALFGQWPWERLPVLPPEMLLLPAWCPLNIYDFGCWARQTVVALTVVGSYQPVRPLAMDLSELTCGTPDPPPRPLGTRAGRFDLLDRVLRIYGRHPVVPLRRLALAQAERWIVQRQEADGSWGGIQPPWVYSLMALHLRGYPLSHPVMEAGLRGLDRFTIDDERGRRLEACQSPVWDTALAVVALSDAGVDAEDPSLQRAATWLLGEEIRVRGDWSVRRPDLAPGGWAFEFENANYPDIDDTAEVVLALSRAAGADADAVTRAVEWTVGMQCRDGGWAAFDVDNTRTLCRELPFCDFGELIDPPTADVTAHMVEMLAVLDRERPSMQRGVQWLLAAQESDGSWFGRWGANFVYGTGAVVPALVAAGIDPAHPAIDRAVGWLESHQNADGGWGEDLRSYRDSGYRGRGASTASQTAWALLALLAAERGELAVKRGVEFLVQTQRDDGNWDEPWFTGTGFPGDFYINYHLYRLVFPVMALGRYVHRRRGVSHD